MYEPKLDINSAIQGYIGADPVISKAVEGYTQPIVTTQPSGTAQDYANAN